MAKRQPTIARPRKALPPAEAPSDGAGLGASPDNSQPAPQNLNDSNQQGPPPPKEPTEWDLIAEFRSLVAGEDPLTKMKELRSLVSRILQKEMGKHEIAPKYNWLFIHDPLSMTRADADSIYNAISNFAQNQEIALIVTSGGGEIEPAYLISKLCRESTTGKFITVVPRRAKSAATLLCCGSDEIHMGQMSELGPIDPQINDLPALGLKNAVQHLAELANQYPKASDMFAKYLSSSLNLSSLGYYERIAESAVQYAERLLGKRVVPLKSKPRDVAFQLVYGFKDHGFVIDKTEAQSIFGEPMIKGSTKEYDLGNSVYFWLSLVTRICDSHGYGFYFYGNPTSDCNFFAKKK